MRSVVEISGLGLRPANGVWTPSDVRDRVSGAEHFEEGDDDPITEQAWDSIQEACLELGLSWGEAQQFIADVAGIPLMDLDPSQFTWRHYAFPWEW